MMTGMLKKIIFRFAPERFIKSVQQFKKKRRNRVLHQQAKTGGLTQEDLIAELRTIGITEGDTVLVHSALSKIGYLKDGPRTLVAALLETVGNTGNILMPTSPNNKRQLDYIKELEVFDVQETPSRLGAVTEYFRKLPEAKRSIHPTEPVACIGPDTEYFVDAHFGQLTPYNENSPFYRVAEKNGKILMIGVTLDNAGTNLHCLEDAVTDFKFPIYYHEIQKVKIRDYEGNEQVVETKIHNPEWSVKRKCDELIPIFEKRGVLKKVQVGEAETLLIDARKMLDVMIDAYEKNGITMYTPQGS